MFLYLFISALSIFVYILVKRKRYKDLHDEHCLITGGSSGIGLSLAIQCFKQGASVTIIARSKSRLETAKQIISSVRKNDKQKILTFSVDISTEANDLKIVIAEAEKTSGPVTTLFNCAGTSIAKTFEDTSITEFKDLLNVNYLGSVIVTQAVLPLMKERRKGKIVFVSSLAGIIGLYGYSAYSGSKFAILGMAEALQMEVKPYNINITVSFPPDTDTPGFAEEIKHKPIETSKISDSGGFFSADDVAKKTLSDVLNKKFMSSVGFEGHLLCILGSSCTPVNSFFQLVIQATTMGFIRLAIFAYLLQYDFIVKKCFKEKEDQKISSDNKCIQSS